jgi:hypothetical protein
LHEKDEGIIEPTDVSKTIHGVVLQQSNLAVDLDAGGVSQLRSEIMVKAMNNEVAYGNTHNKVSSTTKWITCILHRLTIVVLVPIRLIEMAISALFSRNKSTANT